MLVNEAIERLKALCSRQEKCISDIRKKLQSWGIVDNKIPGIIQNLLDNNYIHEGRYSSSFAHDKFKFQKWGKIKISYSLKQKGINTKYIDEALNKIDENEYFNTLYKELNKKLTSLKSKNNIENKGKLYRYAVSKGFESELIYQALQKLL